MARALVTSAAAWLLSMDQPTTRRENASSTTAQYTLPRGHEVTVGACYELSRVA
jgi:hypothetical protein